MTNPHTQSARSGRAPALPGAVSAGLHRFALLTAGATLALIFVGGLVTSTGSALAVPDWPLSFGRFFPRMEGGVLYEHGHRMVAGAVALMTLALMAWTLKSERRVWVRRIAVAALALVVFQAVLGGLTVLLRLPLAIAVAHAGTAQAFFCLMVAMSLITGPRWESLPHLAPEPARPALPLLAATTAAVIYLQILIGAVMRHLGAGLAIPDFPLSFGRLVPPLDSTFVTINFAHRCGGALVALLAGWTAARVLRFHGEEPQLRRPALGMLVLLVLQVCLGALTVWSGRAVLVTTLHVAVGAGVLASSLVLTLRSYRMLAVTPSARRTVHKELAPSAADRNRLVGEVTA